MKRLSMFLLAAGLLSAVQAAAVAPGLLLEFNDSPMGTVLFDGAVHQAAGFSCLDCHNDWLFPSMRKGATTITMAAITSGRMCGGCHNGIQAFAPEGNCERCHIQRGK